MIIEKTDNSCSFLIVTYDTYRTVVLCGMRQRTLERLCIECDSVQYSGFAWNATTYSTAALCGMRQRTMQRPCAHITSLV